MKKILVFGNSGSGKSSLAKQLCDADGLSHLDLDTLAWLPGTPPQRRPMASSGADISAFIAANTGWVIEGCYADLLELALPCATEIVYLDLAVSRCIDNARNRPWEPHKYQSKQAQDANLDMLLEWISQYPTRDDTFSASAHQKLFNGYPGKKTRLTDNPSCLVS